MKYKIIFFFIILTNYSFAQRLNDDQKEILLDKQNMYREVVGVRPLSWSDALAAEAYKEVTNLAANIYSADIGSTYGVNIYRSIKEPNINYAVSNWVQEQKYFHGEPVTEQNLRIFGRYTQVVWSSTISVGCEMAKTPGGLYILLCLYDPKGNKIGEKPY